MGYLDELSRLFADDRLADDPEDTLEVDALPLDRTPFGIAREQLDGERTGFHEGPDGTFRACGSRFGCGYAEAVVTVDPQTGHAAVDINSNLRLSPENVKGARKLVRRLNQSFIIPGLTVDDEGWLRFRPEEPARLLDGDDVSEHVGKGFSTIHAHAHMVAQLEAGRATWDVLKANQSDDEEERDGLREALRRLVG